MSGPFPPYDDRAPANEPWPEQSPYSPPQPDPSTGGFGVPTPPPDAPGYPYGAGEQHTNPSSFPGESGGNGGYGAYGAYGAYGGYGPPSGVPGPSVGTPPGAENGGWGVGQPAYGAPYGAEGYGQPAPNSYRPNRSRDDVGPGNGYGEWGPPSQTPGWPVGPDPRSAGQWGAQPVNPWDARSPANEPPRRRNRFLTYTILAVVLLVVVCGGGYLGLETFGPQLTVNGFCGALKTQHYTDAYSQLGATMRGQITAAQFVRDAEMLDTAEGVVRDCGTGNGSAGMRHSFAGASAASGIVVKRTSSTFQGTMTLSTENGDWKVQSLDSSIFGVNLQAVKTIDAYCVAMQSGSFADAYAVFGATMTHSLTPADYAATGQAQDAVDGATSACQMTGVGPANTDIAANVTITLVRAKLGQRQGVVGLSVEGNAWKIRAMASSLGGTDVGGAVVAQRFCGDLGSAKYADIYTLFSDSGKGGASEDDLAAIFSGNSDDIQWSSCTPDLTSYTVTGTGATLNMDLHVKKLSTGQEGHGTVTFVLEKYGAAWLIDTFKVKS